MAREGPVRARRMIATPSSWSKLIVGMGFASGETGDEEEPVPLPGELVAELEGCFEESDTTSGENAPFDSGAGSVESVVVAVLLLTDFNLGGTTDFDDSDAATELDETLLQLALVELRGDGVSNDQENLLAASLDGVLESFAVENDSIVFGDGDGTSAAEHFGSGAFEFNIQLVGQDRSTG
jgi:hypothetical protein